MNSQLSLLRIAAVSPKLKVANPRFNTEEIRNAIEDHKHSDIILFPELAMTGYTCGNLFKQSALLETALDLLDNIATCVKRQLVVVGAPIRYMNSLYNCAVVFNEGKIIGIVPKQYLPTYNEFYESYWFVEGHPNMRGNIVIADDDIPFGTNFLFQMGQAVVGIEICEDLWMPLSPSSFQAAAGANVLLNLSASNELVAKCEYRRELVSNQSGRCIAAYAYASSGPGESTTDLVFGGHCLIAENGRMLGESERVGSSTKIVRDGTSVTTDVDIERLMHDRAMTTSFGKSRSLHFDMIPLAFEETSGPIVETVTPGLTYEVKEILRSISPTPFIPSDSATLHRRCQEIFSIQTHALAKRLERTGSHSKFCIGISGGSDSTIVALVLAKALDAMAIPRDRVQGWQMRCYGTTEKTHKNAEALIAGLGFTPVVCDIRQLVLNEFKATGYAPFGIDVREMTVETFTEALAQVPTAQRHDLRFENTQARIRTELMMNAGFVLGTGDMSELALGWCTYNADHMSMYNVNCSIPKTLVKFLIKYVAENEYADVPNMKETLLSIVGTVVSPELLPPSATGEIEQSTEDHLGPYELHDFFLFYFVRCGFSPRKILKYAKVAFGERYGWEFIKRTLRTFLTRFFSQQFKRSCVPDGPKVGSVSLSPRGDWRMPSDADVEIWLNELDAA